MGKTPRTPETEYMTLRISPENKPELLEALHIAAWMNDSEGAGIAKPEARMAEAFRRIIIDWLLENRFQYHRAVAKGVVNAEYAQQSMDALVRDGFRCRKCKHTKASMGGVRAEQIVGFDMIAGKMLGGAEEAVWPGGRFTKPNLITLCGTCADQWRGLSPERRCKAVPAMLREIGESERLAGVTGLLLHPAA